MKPISLLPSVISFLLASSAFPQGPLTPPGPPAPTMKTLDQLDGKLDTTNSKLDTVNAKTEKRIPIDAAHTPGDAESLFIISAPGSYYLTGNITGVSGKNGIQINADSVTVDLNGFALLGVAGSNSGIFSGADIRVHNGIIRRWGFNGIYTYNGRGQFDHLLVLGNLGSGMLCGIGGTLTDCRADQNDMDGFSVGNSSTIIACTAEGNTRNGIAAGSRSTILHCSAALNGMGSTTPASGIFAEDRATISECSATGNGKDGIVFGDDSVVIGNHASNNGANGLSSSNAFPRDPAKPDAGSGSRIDSNHARDNGGYGIMAGQNIDVVIRNDLRANALGNYRSNAGFFFGASWGPIGNPRDATSPWANFQ